MTLFYLLSIYRTRMYKKVGKLYTTARYYCIKTGKSREAWKDPPGYKTNIKIYNSSVKRKTELITQENRIISWYCCGPTVYDSAHIGHACCYIRFDIIRRLLEEIFLHRVVLVMGITDIDDKIIKRANEDGVNFKTITQFYEKEFFKDMDSLNIKKPTITARVSDYVQEIINFVQKIIDNGYGYVTSDGTVNFPVDKYDGYGVLHSAQEEFNNNSSEKQSSKDFAMWKGAKPDEPSWNSPWGMGRPGWHIECSAIASKLLGKRLDIHSGGIDLKFPHHENEEAQCCIYHNVNSWVTYWMHSGHVYLGSSGKMSKSLKNTISINEFLKKYTSDDLRMLCLMVPYRNGIEYGDEVMENALTVHKKLRNFINDCNGYIAGSKPLGSFDEATLLQDLNETQESVLNCLANDFDTSTAISQLIQFVTRANTAFNEKKNSMENPSYFGVLATSSYVESFLSKCGFTSLTTVPKTNDSYEDISSILTASIQLRSSVRDVALRMNRKIPELGDIKTSLLTACDEFRKDVYSSGIELKDHGKTTSWNFTDNIKK